VVNSSNLSRGLALVFTLSALVGYAQSNPYTRNIDLVVDKPTPTQDSAIAVDGAVTRVKGSYQLEFLLDANFGLMALNSGNQQLGNLIPFRLDGHFMGSYQLLRWLELSADLPVTFYQSQNFGLLTSAGITTTGVDAAGLGDFRVLPRFTLLRPEQTFLGLGVGAVAEVRFPTGNGQSFMGGDSFVFAPRATAERAFGPVRLLLNLGIRIREPGQFLNLEVHNELQGGLAAIWALPFIHFAHVDRPELLAEMNLSTAAQDPLTFSGAIYNKSPWELLVGARAHVAERWGVELDLGRGLTGEPGYGREGFRVIGAVRYDLDKGRKPPPGLDRDGDGVADSEDRCPNLPGPASNHGCPLNQDTDGDGIPDAEDACPEQAGPAEYDGCPDSDGDQIPDNVDKCPDRPGPAENEGCPVNQLVTLESNKIKLNGTVLFDTGRATIQPQSFPLLNEVFDILKRHPELGVVRVEGHTDNRGGREYNQDLSERRAHAVLQYLVTKGIPQERLRSKGYGFEKPIDTNDTALGRAKNRRVAFVPLGKAPLAEGVKPGESLTSTESVKVESAKPTDSAKPIESAKPAESTKASGSAKPAGSTKPVGSTKPAKSTKAAGSTKSAGSTKAAK
jgi:outer membrane protein OmpA-like peptidoglycan-associated protein